ncbi:MAG: N-acetyltransferase [Candidatus Bathyarchaeota archaeon]|nr:N-acetyltransferase [Candidatus Bathyarchaeota archaeon]
MQIREAREVDLEDVLFVEREAFGYDKEANLTRDMLFDPTAKPLLSLLAYIDNQPAGHILFTKGALPNEPHVKISLLAPLAVVPKFQNQKVGKNLIKHGLAYLKKSGVELVFVLGHPAYYPKAGFTPAAKFGLQAPFPIPKEVADAWMVQELRPNVLGSVKGTIVCCEALNKPQHWRE